MYMEKALAMIITVTVMYAVLILLAVYEISKREKDMKKLSAMGDTADDFECLDGLK